MPSFRLLLLFTCLAVASPAALAQRAKSVVPELDAEGLKGDMARAAQKKANERFAKADADHDGEISQAEAASALPYIAENFARYDKDTDGKLSWEEFIGHDKWKRGAVD